MLQPSVRVLQRTPQTYVVSDEAIEGIVGHTLVYGFSSASIVDQPAAALFAAASVVDWPAVELFWPATALCT